MLLLQKLADGKPGNLDIRVLYRTLIKKNLKTATSLKLAEDIPHYLEFYEYLHKQSPVTFAYLNQEIKQLIYKAMQLGQEQRLPLQQMVKFAKIMIPSLYKPAMLFGEMILNKNENFREHVQAKDLEELVEEIDRRARDGEFEFEHLQLSSSRVHKNYRPFIEKTIILLQRIMNDLTCS